MLTRFAISAGPVTLLQGDSDARARTFCSYSPGSIGVASSDVNNVAHHPVVTVIVPAVPTIHALSSAA